MTDQAKYINKLEGSRVLILGGTSGIGYCGAEASLEYGATVIVSSSNPDRVKSTVSRLQSSYPSKKTNISGFACNLGSDDTLETNLEQLLQSATDNGQKKLDHIIFSAADPLAVMDLPEINIKKMHDAGRIRFFAPLLLGKLAPKYMNHTAQSSITITTGGVSVRPIAGWAVIGSYAAGHHGMARGLALDLAPLRVNAISPGLVDTELWKDMAPEARDKLYKETANHLPLGKVATPQEVAETYIYLMKDTNCTGTVVSSDGGHLLK